MPDWDWLQDEIEPLKPEYLGWLKDETLFESPDTLDRPLKMIQKPRRRYQKRALRQEKLEEFFTELPQPGETLHVVSNGSFDYWNFVPVTLALLRRPAVFYGSTWTLNRSNALQLLRLLDAKQLTAATMFSGLYFKRREPAVYAALASGFIDRGQRFLCFENHTKIMLIGAPPDFIVIEGSANFTYNPRTEQNTVTNDEEVFNFHRSWMEDLLANAKSRR